VWLEIAVQSLADKHLLDDIGADNAVRHNAVRHTAVRKCAKARFDAVQINGESGVSR